MFCLKAARALQSCTLLAVDGEIGSVEQFYFDTQQWAIRYLVVNSGRPHAGRRRLISPVAVGDVRSGERQIHIELTSRQIRNSPAVDTLRPVSRHFEERYFDYYGWPPYWQTGASPGCVRVRRSFFRARRAGNTPAAPPAGENLRATTEIRGIAVTARDGSIGQVVDFFIDSRYWVIRYLDIDTRDWWQGRRVLISPGWLDHIDWTGRTAAAALTRDAVRQAPEFDSSGGIDRDYEARLFRNYGYPGYWQQG